MTRNIINNCDIIIEISNRLLCILKEKAKQINTIDHNIFNNLLTEINLNPPTTKELEITKEDVNNDKEDNIFEVITKFNDTITKDFGWNTFQNNNRDRFNKNGDYIKLPKEKPRRFKKTINILKNWINTQLDLYNNFLQYFRENKDKKKNYRNLDDYFLQKITNIIYGLQNIKAKINGILTYNHKEYQGYRGVRYGAADVKFNHTRHFEIYKQKENEICFKNFNNAVKDILENLIPKASSFQKNELNNLKQEILKNENKKL